MKNMPSADMRTVTNSNNTNTLTTTNTEIGISSKDVENLVMEIKENLRLSTGNAMKSVSFSHLSRKTSRASPYRIPSKHCCGSQCGNRCLKKSKAKIQQDCDEDPYELLQRLLKDGSLVSEAVRRLQLGLSPKQRYFYESDDDLSPATLYKREI